MKKTSECKKFALSRFDEWNKNNYLTVSNENTPFVAREDYIMLFHSGRSLRSHFLIHISLHVTSLAPKYVKTAGKGRKKKRREIDDRPIHLRFWWELKEKQDYWRWKESKNFFLKTSNGQFYINTFPTSPLPPHMAKNKIKWIALLNNPPPPFPDFEDRNSRNSDFFFSGMLNDFRALSPIA